MYTEVQSLQMHDKVGFAPVPVTCKHKQINTCMMVYMRIGYMYVQVLLDMHVQQWLCIYMGWARFLSLSFLH